MALWAGRRTKRPVASGARGDGGALGGLRGGVSSRVPPGILRAGGRRRAAGASALGRRAARLRARAVCPLLSVAAAARRRREARGGGGAPLRVCAAPAARHPPGLRAEAAERRAAARARPRRGRPLRPARAAPPERRARRAYRVRRRSGVAACRLAPELCVDALLLLANFSLARAGGEARARAQRVDVSIDAAPKQSSAGRASTTTSPAPDCGATGSLRAGRPGHRRAEGRAGVLAISVQPQTGERRRRDGGNLRADADALLGAVRRVAAARGVSLPGVWARAGQGIERQRVGACEVVLSALADDGSD